MGYCRDIVSVDRSSQPNTSMLTEFNTRFRANCFVIAPDGAHSERTHRA